MTEERLSLTGNQQFSTQERVLDYLFAVFTRAFSWLVVFLPMSLVVVSATGAEQSMLNLVIVPWIVSLFGNAVYALWEGTERRVNKAYRT